MKYDNENILFIRYEDWHKDNKKTLIRVLEFCNLPTPRRIVNVKKTNEGACDSFLRKIKSKIFFVKKIQHSAVEFPKGEVGDYKYYFSEGDLNLFVNLIGKEFIEYIVLSNKIKLNHVP